MSEFTLYSSSEQVVMHLRKEIFRGRWSETMPGAPALAKELEVDHKAVEAALRRLEDEGLLVAQGAGRQRRIELPPGRKAVASMKIAILTYTARDRQLDFVINLQHSLAKAGHHAFFSAQSLTELGMKVPRIRRTVKSVEADAWVLCAASSEVLQWFSEQPALVFALFGRMDKLPIAGTKPGKAAPLVNATRQLIGLGHRRISLLAQSTRRLPEPGHLESLFLKELESHGIQTSTYNLPDWDDSTEGFHQALDTLFAITPPTALILQEAPLLFAAQQFLQSRGLRVPQDVSLICTDNDPYFSWCTPSIAHIHWDNRPVVRRVINWAANISRGKTDIRQSFTPAEFVAGGTMGPAGS
jgi:DNA-binding LacI/PurR family transcriptional regulator